MDRDLVESLLSRLATTWRSDAMHGRHYGCSTAPREGLEEVVAKTLERCSDDVDRALEILRKVGQRD